MHRWQKECKKNNHKSIWDHDILQDATLYSLPQAFYKRNAFTSSYVLRQK